MAHSSRVRVLSVLYLSAVFTFFATIFFWILLLPVENLVTSFTPDDAYYYLVIARNAANGVFSSFDGMHLTNGYHPLWAGVLLILFPFMNDTIMFLRLALLLCLLLYCAAAYLLYRIVKQDLSQEAAILGTALFCLFIVPSGWYLLEAPLAIFLLALFLQTTLRQRHRATTTGQIWLGLVAGLTILARLDAFFIVVPLMYRNLKQHRYFLPAFAGAAILLPYLIYNLVAYGHVVPISGALKSSFPVPEITNLPLAFRRWVRILVPISCSFLFLIYFTRRKIQDSRLADLRWACAGVLAFSAYELFFQKDARWSLWSWHFAVPTFFCLIPAIHLATQIFRKPVAVIMVAFVCLLAAGADAHRQSLEEDPALLEFYRSGIWIRDNLEAEAVLAITDPGIIAFFGEKRTISLDGLVNNFEFQKVLATKSLEEYLDRNRVTHLGVFGRERPDRYEIFDVKLPARMFSGKSDTLGLPFQNQIYVSPAKMFALWIWKPSSPKTNRR